MQDVKLKKLRAKFGRNEHFSDFVKNDYVYVSSVLFVC